MRCALLFILAALLAACSSEPPAPVEPVRLRYEVEGMHCDGCVAAIRTKVLAIEGVSECTVSLDDHDAEIAIADPRRADELTGRVEEAIRGLHYTIQRKE